MLTRLRMRFHDEAGFTLPELLISMTILAVIMLPLAQVVTSYFLNAEAVRARQAESKDQQIASHYWSSDVASVGQRDTTFGAVNGINVATCGSAPAGGSPQISLTWTSYTFTPPSTTTASSTTTVTYYSTPSTATTEGTLVRRVCAGGSPVSNTIARSLKIDGAHPITCSTNGTAFAGCLTLSGGGGTGVFLKFFVEDSSGKGKGYWTTLGGQRRQT